MFFLVIQTLLLMAIAFILGAVLGALLRTLFGSTETEADAASATAKASGTDGEAVSKSKTTPRPMKVAEIPKPPVPSIPEEPAEKAKVVAAPPPPAKSKSKKASGTKTGPKKKVVASKATKPKAQKAPAKPKRTPRKTPDNLKLIRGIGPKNEGRLNALGVNQFAQIAVWKKKDVIHYGEVLNFPDRIKREEWVKQAKVLARGGATKFSKRVKAGNVESSLRKTKSANAGKKPTGLRSTPRRGKADKLTVINGVGPAIEKKLNKVGIYHFDQISKMTKPQLAWLGDAIGFPGRPERESWVKGAKASVSAKTAKAAAPKRRATKPKGKK